MTDAQQAFGPTLRTHRERHGITLTDIAESTKISIALLAALERNDLSRWPRGIYRRAFFREYVVAIGLSPDPLLAEFADLFPDESGAPVKAQPASEFRLALADNRATTIVGLRRIAVAIGELAAVLVVGGTGAWLLSVDVWSASGVAALAYYPVTNICVERRFVRIRQPLVVWLRSRFNAMPRRHEGIDLSAVARSAKGDGHEGLQASC